MSSSTSGQCLCRTVKETTLGRVEKAKAGGETGTSDYKAGYEKALQAARNLQSERDRVVNELGKLSNESGKASRTAVKKTVAETRDQKPSNHNVTSTHGNPDGSCMRTGGSSWLGLALSY